MNSASECICPVGLEAEHQTEQTTFGMAQVKWVKDYLEIRLV